MPFMKGSAPVRRTLKYLEAGRLKFKPEIKVMTINYNINQNASVGAYEFQFWHLPQLRYKNPGVQLCKFKNMTPTPFIQLLFGGGEKVLIDVYGRSRQDIFNHLLETFCVTREEMEQSKRTWNKGAFGYGCDRWCICEVPGQVPCPAFTSLPKHMRGKYKNAMAENS